MRRRPLIIANWKMKLPDPAQELKLARAAVTGVKKYSSVDLVIAPSFLSLVSIKKDLKSSVALAAQDCGWRESGADTGEVSPVALEKAGCKYVLIGHSERRAQNGESDSMIAQKLEAVYSTCSKITAILCIGETASERTKKQTLKAIERQLSVLSSLNISVGRSLVIAYEPVWSIGTGATPTPAECSEVCDAITVIISQYLGLKKMGALSILYGGSVTPMNAMSFLGDDGADGLLVGGASLKTPDLLAIVAALSAK